jgi:serine/threonine protein kinase
MLHFLYFYFIIFWMYKQEAMVLSEPRLISPLLDDFLMGDPISRHHGIQCCPAMRKSNDDKYIVKVISVPASQVQLDALLLTGAYRDEDAALEYFRELSGDLEQEADLLKRLSKLEGFDAYEGCQIVPMDDGIGFDVYLLGTYKRSLDRFSSRKPMTHLSAVNLGLDMCAALSVARKAGYLYLDLKPGNIFYSAENGFHIGDLGFIKLSSLKYAALPEKYRSSWTAPELVDAYASLNETVDIYALGMILYQVYNDGQLPFSGPAPQEVLPAPAYADPEMAEIILKACAPDPEDRWQDPTQMGQALANYMQTNVVNDTPIVPVAEPEEAEATDLSSSNEADEEPVGAYLAAEPSQPETPENPDDATADEMAFDSDSQQTEAEGDAAVIEIHVDSEHADTESHADAIEINLDESSIQQESTEDFEVKCESDSEEDEEESLQISIDDILAEANDQSAPLDDNSKSGDLTLHIMDDEVTDEVTQMLAQADELLSHPAPTPVVAPDPIDVPMPEPIIKEVPAEPAEEASDLGELPQEEQSFEAEAASDAVTAIPEEPSDGETQPAHFNPDELEGEALDAYEDRVARRKGILIPICILLSVLLLIGSCMFFYHYYYLQEIQDLEYSVTDEKLIVSISTRTDESELTVYCTDIHGNSLRSGVVNGTAVFQDLLPGTDYKITVEIGGFHKLIGETSANITTAKKTTILSFTALTGAEDGSVILRFETDSQAPDEWKILYSAPGEHEQEITTTGRIVTLTGLKVGTQYTFRLVPTTDIVVDGTSQIQHTVSNIIYAQQLQISAYKFTSLTVAWQAPEGVRIDEWTVRCYNQNGYDKVLTAEECIAVFEGIDSTQSYTIEVTAAGMTQNTRIYVSANPIVVKDIETDMDEEYLYIYWDYEGEEPKGGWIVIYSKDHEEALSVISAQEARVIIDGIVSGSTYEISIRPANGVDVFDNTITIPVP